LECNNTKGEKVKIQSIRIEGFWGNRTIDVRFNDDVNIVIGENGSGKTIFLNIVNSILCVDVENLITYEFDLVRIVLYEKSKTRKIQVVKTVDEFNHISIEYKIGARKFPISSLSDIEFRSQSRFRNRRRLDVINLREEMFKYVSLCWLSVSRELKINEEPSAAMLREYRNRNQIDERLENLMSRLAIYRLQLEAESGKLSDQFKKKVLELMLFSKEFDEIDLNKIQPIAPEKMEEKLVSAYGALGLKDEEIRKKMSEHISKISEAILKIIEFRDKKTKLYVNDAMPLALEKRTKHVIEISEGIEENRRDVFRLIEKYSALLQKFIKNKKFGFESGNTGGLVVTGFRDAKNKMQLPIRMLSSGEKQLIIILTEALLQNQAGFVFIADEPELSLHIGWQKELIGAILQLNTNSQIIVATHSPEIAGYWESKLIQMEDINRVTK